MWRAIAPVLTCGLSKYLPLISHSLASSSIISCSFFLAASTSTPTQSIHASFHGDVANMAWLITITARRYLPQNYIGSPSIHWKRNQNIITIISCYAYLPSSHQTPPWSTWLSGKTSVSSQRSFAVLRLTCSWWVTTYVRKPSAIGQPLDQANSVFHPLGVDKWVLSRN